jgi:alkaline phosphatase
MQYETERATDPAGEPSLSEMTRAALTMLQKNPKGYFLMVEGGRIDHGHHAGNAFRALNETIEFAHAVEVANAMTSVDDTLILVTADHSHTLTFVGYPARGNPILGKVRGIGEEDAGESEYALDGTGKPFTTLVYANGPGNTGASDSQPAGPKTFPHRGKGYKPVQGRPDLTNVDTTAPDYMQESLVPLGNESHGGDDVGIWAIGPGSDAVRGNVEQNAIFHFLLQANPRLRAALCAKDDCENGIPVALPKPEDFQSRP